MVHITNGDVVAEKLRRWAGEPRLIIWHDALHEGPVHAGLTLEQMTAERAAWWEANGFGSGRKLQERDRQLRHLVLRDSVWMWFEDDLYDQLQLLQCLHFLYEEGLTVIPHFIVDIPRTLEVEQMAGLAASKVRVTPEMFDTATRAWTAFTAGTVPALLETDLSALPHLRPAMERLLQHRPGKNRVEQTILKILSEEGGRTAQQLFAEYQETEERPFLGDTIFFWYLNNLAPRVTKDAHGIYRLPNP